MIVLNSLYWKSVLTELRQADGFGNDNISYYMLVTKPYYLHS